MYGVPTNDAGRRDTIHRVRVVNIHRVRRLFLMVYKNARFGYSSRVACQPARWFPAFFCRLALLPCVSWRLGGSSFLDQLCADSRCLLESIVRNYSQSADYWLSGTLCGVRRFDWAHWKGARNVGCCRFISTSVWFDHCISFPIPAGVNWPELANLLYVVAASARQSRSL